MQFERVPLEDWMRDFYFDTPLDLGSSGVQNFTFPEVCELTGFRLTDFESLVFNDSTTLGSLGLRQAIANQFGDGNADNVMVANGSNDASFLLMASLLRAGDEVVAIDPIYHTLGKLTESIGCHVKRYALSWDNHFEVDMDALTDLISETTRMVVVNFPHNPTGTTITRAQQKQLIEAARRVDAYLVWDAAFENLVHDTEPLPNPVLEYERAISIGTMSKEYGMAGVRVGWCIGAREHFEPAVLWKDYTSLYVSPLIEMVAQKAIENADKLRNARWPQVRTNFKTLKSWIKTNQRFVQWAPPKGGVTAFVHFPNVQSTDHFCRQLAQHHGVMLVPGTAFKHPQHARLGFGGPTDDFQEGLEKLTMYLRDYS